MTNYQHNSITKKYLYHITQNLVPEGIFLWEPKNIGQNRCMHEPKVPRICFSDNISGCFIALGECLSPHKDILVLKTLRPIHYYIPKEIEVLDVKITGEVWRLKPVKLKQIAKIKPQDLIKQNPRIYDYLKFNPGIKDNLIYQSLTKPTINTIIKKYIE